MACNDARRKSTPLMHVNGFVQGRGKFIRTEYVAADEELAPFPLLRGGADLSQYNVGAQGQLYRECGLACRICWRCIHDAELRGLREGNGCAWPAVRARRRCGPRSPTGCRRAWSTPPSRPDTQANVVTTDYSDWATNCPEYKVTAVQVGKPNGPSDWQVEYNGQAANSRRILPAAE